jgi:hypothetical protein
MRIKTLKISTQLSISTFFACPSILGKRLKTKKFIQFDNNSFRILRRDKMLIGFSFTCLKFSENISAESHLKSKSMLLLKE